MVIRLMLLMALLLPFASNAFTQLSATIDKNPVMVNESFTLTITADARLNTAQLDTSALMRDFTVGHTGTSTQTQIVNRDVQHATVWTIVLISRKTGKFVIPSFTIDNVSSLPITVEVINASQSTSGKAREVFLETSVDKSSVYLQSSISYTTKLYLALDFQRGSLTEPKMENANIAQINSQQGEESSEIRDGVRYRVITRVYSISPQRSGDYTIAPPLFNGELVVKRQRSFFSGFNNTKPVSVLGDEIKISVLPIPQDYNGQWLPSERVVLSEQWQPEEESYTVGDPITRIITLSAIGVNEEQLPEIDVSYPDTVKTYPDQSTLHSATRQNRLISQRKDSVAIVPSKPGMLTLPEVKIPWFNTDTNATEYATLPAKTIEVKPAAMSNVPATSAQQQYTVPVDVPPAQVVTEIKEVPVNGWMTWTFLGAWLLSMVLWMLHVRLLKSRGISNAPEKDGATATSGRTYFNLFAKACKAGDAKTAANELLRWGRARWPEQKFTSAMEVAMFLGAQEVISGVKEMQFALYSPKQANWQGQALLDAVSKNKNPNKASNQDDSLNPLHPA